ncbi:hypothetical protein N7540_004765 [Penicillium herquei]|nr:hypothetical protein N7540_004765 [Penicillium herquei]
MMQDQLSRLTATLDNRQNSVDRVDRIGDKQSSMPTPPSTGHVVSDADGQIQRYHGPWTLLAQCRQLETDLASWSKADHAVDVTSLVTSMVQETMRIPSSSFASFHEIPGMGMCLPPRQLLSVMVECFLKNADYATSIFDHQSLYCAIDRVYRDPSNPEEKPWVLCFNLIILLTLGAEHSLQSEDPFVRPMLQAVQTAAGNSRLLMEPRLVSVQALALFSLFMQQCYPDNEPLGDGIFAQACVLARQMGLPQPHGYAATPSTLTAAEVDERHRVYQSLYIRNRYATTTSGALMWLPNSIMCSGTASAVGAHWELAKLQDEIHRVLGSCSIGSSDRRIKVAQLREKLRVWQEACLVTDPQTMSMDRVILCLLFLGTRIYISMDNKETDTESFLDDCRLSCLLLIVSCTKHLRPDFSNQFHHLLHRLNPSRRKSEGSLHSSPSSTPSSSSTSSPLPSPASERPPPLDMVTRPSTGTSTPSSTSLLPLPRLANAFPITAIFILARHIVGISAEGKSISTHRTGMDLDSDILLLESLLFCFQNNPPFLGGKDQSTHCSYKLGQVLDHLVRIIHTITTDRTSSRAHASGLPLGTDHGEVSDYMSRMFMTSKPSPEASDLAGLWYPRDVTGDTPMDLSMPDFQSVWPTPQDSLASSTNPLATAEGSIYTPALHPTPIIPNTPLDLSELFGFTNSDASEVWNLGTETTDLLENRRPSLKRQRTHFESQ